MSSRERDPRSTSRRSAVGEFITGGIGGAPLEESLGAATAPGTWRDGEDDHAIVTATVPELRPLGAAGWLQWVPAALGCGVGLGLVQLARGAASHMALSAAVGGMIGGMIAGSFVLGRTHVRRKAARSGASNASSSRTRSCPRQRRCICS